MKSLKNFSIFLLLTLFPLSSVQAYWVWSPQAGKFVNADGESQDAADEKYDYALKLYRDRNLDQAEEQFEFILKQFPNSKTAPEALYRLGMVQEEKGDYLKAFKTYKRLIETYPQSERFAEVIEREFRIGNLFLSGKKARIAGLEILPSLPKAADIFQHIAQYAPYSDYGDKAQFQLGLTYKKMHRYGDAAAAFQALVDQYPKSPLTSQARFQLAETSYMRSGAEYRDQRVLDDASKQVDRFLTAYPDSEAAENAAKLRQAIDEKNAEKNFRIGSYYEKENYLESALLYYEDVSKRYPNTKWGQKALDKLKALKQPAQYLSAEEKKIIEEEEALKAEVAKLEKGTDPIALDIARRKLERSEKSLKGLEKNKKDSMERRRQDLNRRERELKEKFKNLETKRKLLKKNPSEDLRRAIDRWHASLVEEQDSLLEERKQLKGWQEELGVHEKKIDLGFLPFLGEEPSEIEKVRQIEAKKFYKLSEQKKSVLEEKELLYKHYGEVSSLIETLDKQMGPSASFDPLAPGVEPADLKTIRLQMESYESELKQKTEELEASHGQGKLAGIGNAVRDSVSRSVAGLNPFDRESQNDPAQALLEKQMHLNERIATQQNLVQTLTSAFDAQLATREKQRLLAQAGSKENVDPLALRKSIKNLERKLRSGYEEIEERHNRKKDYLNELSKALKQKGQEDRALRRTGRAVAAPAVGAARGVKAFLFGLPHREVELTKSAEQVQAGPDTVRIKELEEKIKSESLLIDAKSREINNLQKELEVLKAKASLSGGYKFRPIFIKAPYLFVEEAVDSARRVIPKKNREELLINRLNEETKKLEDLKGELLALEVEVAKLPGGASESAKAGNQAPVKGQAASQEKLKNEILALKDKIEERKQAYKQGKEIFKTAQEAVHEEKSAEVKSSKKIRKQSEKLKEEMEDIQKELAEIIAEEKKLEDQESTILDKRITAIDKAMKGISSKSLSQDLMTERERMEGRLSQLESRKDFLSKEQKRFEPVDAAKAGGA